MSKPLDKNWEAFKRKQILGAILFLLVLFTVAGLLSLHFEQELRDFTQSVVDQLGFWGLAALVLVSDSVTSPLPPDAILFVIAKSSLHENWKFYVTIISLCSVMAGSLGWLIGRFIAKRPWAPPFVLNFAREKEEYIKKYGPLVVVLGALTPLPFSITCWGAGLLNMKWLHFFYASLFRIPRLILTYLVLANSSFIF